jgi:hypothetical protein
MKLRVSEELAANLSNRAGDILDRLVREHHLNGHALSYHPVPDIFCAVLHESPNQQDLIAMTYLEAMYLEIVPDYFSDEFIQ